MKCPIDQNTLVITERQNIEIDYCPECRGVWMDRGELDKVIEGSQSIADSLPVSASREYSRSDRDPTQYSNDQYHKKKKKESFLGELFDF